ncbi:MAG: metallophosphoesterase, partial [Candidatus Poseidoniales archaeon]|nr:metallophosphoesterase [Candidatus Poseidoniales archaeon]
MRSPREFRVCVFGDTQNYARTWHVPDIKASYTSMAQYAADGNCDAVIHMGDMTDNHGGTHEDDQSMWDANYEALAPIFAAGIPFSPSQGNHDLPSQYELLVDAVNDTSRPFEAVSSSKRSHSLIQKVGGVDQLIISVGCGWAQDEYDFMKDQIATHPGIPTLVHSHISTYGRQVPSFSFSDPIFDSARCPQSHGGTQRPTDQEIADYFRATEQIYVLAGGHWAGFSVGMDSVRNSNHPHPLFLIMENFQNIAGSGDGWFGLLTIDQDSGTAR